MLETLTTDRATLIADFLNHEGWEQASITPFAADWSPRRYARLTKSDNQTAILMDADPGQKTPEFAKIDHLLRAKGLPAPALFAARPEIGLVLLEDFGPRTLGSLADSGQDLLPLLHQGTHLLTRLHAAFNREAGLEGLPNFDTNYFIAQAELFLTAFLPFVLDREADDALAEDFRAAWRAVLRPLEILPKSLVLRDYMLDNLMDRAPDEPGLIDFQDAGIGCIAYDLSSLCEEVRRDGAFTHLDSVIELYRQTTATPLSASDLRRACVIFSAQRHTRILGNLANQVVKHGRQDLQPMLVRVQRHLTGLLNAPYLLPMKAFMQGMGL